MAFAQDNGEVAVTLINGASVSGRVVSISDAGLELMIGSVQRTYPWYSLAPGSRFRLEQSYRMNIEGYLAGQSLSSLTNAPDPEYDPLGSDTVKTETKTDPGPTTERFDFNLFDLRSAVKPARNTAAGAFPVDESIFWALQYGPKSNDVAIFIFNKNDPTRGATAMSWRGRPLTETATRRGTGADAVQVFSQKSYSGQNGETAYAFELEWIITPGNNPRILLAAVVTLSRGDKKTQFKLEGEPLGFTLGNAEVVPRALLVEPQFQFGLHIENERVFLTGRVRMSQLSLLPIDGLDGDARVEVVDAQGRTQWRQQMAFSKDQPSGEPTLRADISALSPDQLYTIKATMSLGPMLGELRHEETIFVPDALKP